MKAIKYVLTGVLAMGLSLTATAQEVDYLTALKPISSAFEAAPGDFTAAKDLIKQYRKDYKKDVTALVALGRAYLAHRDYDAAEALANELTYLKKTDVSDAYVLLGDIAVYRDSVGNAGPAAAQYQTAISLNAKNKLAYERYATVYRHIDLNLSIKALEDYKAIDPSYQVEAKIGELCYGEHQYTKAASWYSKGDASNYDIMDYFKWTASTYYSGKYEECLKTAQNGLKQFPGEASLMEFAFWSAVDASNAEALTLANNYFAKAEKPNARDYAYLGYAQILAKDYAASISNLEKAYEMNDKDVQPLAKISEAYKNLGDEDKALEYSQKYLSLNSRAKFADYRNLAQIYEQKGDKATGADKNGYYDKAIEVYQSLIERTPSASDYGYYFACLVAQKKGDKAAVDGYYKKIVDFAKGKTLTESSKSILGFALSNLMANESNSGNLAGAQEYAKQLLEVDPENESAKHVLNYGSESAE